MDSCAFLCILRDWVHGCIPAAYERGWDYRTRILYGLAVKESSCIRQWLISWCGIARGGCLDARRRNFFLVWDCMGLNGEAARTPGGETFSFFCSASEQ